MRLTSRRRAGESGDALSPAAPELVMNRWPSLFARAALAVVLMIGFYFMALAIAAGLLWIPYAEFTYGNGVHLKLAAICVLGAGIILWSIVPRSDRFAPPRPVLQRAANPRLFAVIDEIASATRQRPPEEVWSSESPISRSTRMTPSPLM
jgi:hypothetical protein